MHDTNSQLTEKNLPCPDCPSSDALCIYDDGHTHCFSCRETKQGEITGGTRPTPKKNSKLLSGVIVDIASRGLHKDTCRKWGVEFVKMSGGQQAIAFPYFDKNNKKVAQKLRTPDKDFSFIGDTKNPRLFGQQLWSRGKKIVITEGEFDAMTVSQIQNHKWPTVSIPTGAPSAKKSITNNLQWLEENFEEIILMFDMDEPGQQAALEVAPLFSPGKCKIASLPHKDANECLMQGVPEEIINAIWNAKPYRPDGIVTVSDVIPKIGLKPTFGFTLPWKRLFDLTFGLKLSQIWVWTSGSGMGKTEFFKDMIAWLVKEHKTKIGVIFLEEETQDTVVDIAGKMVGKCFNSPDIKFNPKERDEAIKQLEDSGCVYMYDHFGHDDYDAIRAVIRHMVAGHGCEVIFLDHITAFTDGMGNEANALAERMMKELASMTRELKFNLQVISHVRKSDSSRKPAEEGGRVKIDDLKGSGAVKQWANMVIALERNQQSEDETVSRTTTVRILKGRGVGKNVGKTVDVIYLPDTAQLIQTDESFGDDLPF